MLNNPLFTENELDSWIRGHAEEAQGTIVELVYRLVAASVPQPQERRFPLADSVGQHGADGKLVTTLDYKPFVPAGQSLWEIGTSINAGAKATKDYNELTAAVPENYRKNSTFVFVTPLSGRRGWEGTWKPEQQEGWKATRRDTGEWSDVRVIDGSILIDWLRQFPSVAKWFAVQMGKSTDMVDTAEQRWLANAAIGEPPPLTPDIFLANRGEACKRLDDLFKGAQPHLQLDTFFPAQVADFVSAYLASLNPEIRVERQVRCLIVSSPESWIVATSLKDPHILIADFDMTREDSPRLLAVARKAGHGAIYAGLPGGEPNPFRQVLLNPRSYQMEEALIKAGYKAERSRNLSQRSDGNLTSLLRCIQNLSALPEWSGGDAAAELTIAELLGAWNQESDADRQVVEGLAGKSYGEWIETLYKVAVEPSTPLTLRDKTWKMVARYEGWYSLGPRISDKLLDAFKVQAIRVFGEIDPKFEIPTDQRFAANVYGKSLRHSESLRKGMADTLALLGSHPGSLTMCSRGKPEAIATAIVSQILNSGDWKLWASVNRYLPLLAEAAPKAFADAVDKALDFDPTPFSEVFAQEGDGITGENHMTGLLWGLESLAWDSNSLTRITVTLGQLAAQDPGGNWANRPINSLIMIFLPWLPQTTASIEQRRTAIKTLIREQPNVAWSLLLRLLPRAQQSSHGIHKPTWKDIGDLKWEKGVTHGEYWEQVAAYADMAIGLAIGNRSRLFELVQRIDDLPPPALEKMLEHLTSDTVRRLTEDEREPIWDELMNVVAKNRKYCDAEWALPKQWVDKIAAVTDKLKPTSAQMQYARLFGNRDLEIFEEQDDFETQHKKLEDLRNKAVAEILKKSEIEGILKFVAFVNASWRVGLSLGRIGNADTDSSLLPVKLEECDKKTGTFISGYITTSYSTRGEEWAASVINSDWTETQVVVFLGYLPFIPWTWAMAARLLGSKEDVFWKRTGANPYDTKEPLLPAIEKLMKCGRPMAALRLIYREMYLKRPPDVNVTADALIAAISSTEEHRHLDSYEIGELIKSLQKDPNTNREKLYQIEWGYSELFVVGHDLHPVTLENALASDPATFCELVRYVYRSKNDSDPKPKHTEQEKRFGVAAWRMLHDWHTPPGSCSDGIFDGEHLISWTQAVLVSASDSGHLEVCQSLIGKVLIHTPPDPDGLWIHRAAATLLNDKDANEMRAGFLNGIYNSRGTHWVDSTGAPERALAAKYRDSASKVETAGYYRFAESLRSLSESYEREANKILENANRED